MELKEGMYIRTKYNDFCNMVAIRKIDEIDDDGSFWIDDYIIDTYGDEQDKLHEEDVEFASEDIVNVIKPGDYVNGVEVEEINDKEIMLVDTHLWIDKAVANRLIESIVTKEQFESMKYGVE